jgi:hypothetical protein
VTYGLSVIGFGDLGGVYNYMVYLTGDIPVRDYARPA